MINTQGHAVLTGMLWVLKKDLTSAQESSIKRLYTHNNPNQPDNPFCTYLELKGKLGIPYGDKEKLTRILPNVHIEDKRIAPLFDKPKVSKLPLRDYQETAMTEILEYTSQGGTEFNLSGFP